MLLFRWAILLLLLVAGVSFAFYAGTRPAPNTVASAGSCSSGHYWPPSGFFAVLIAERAF